MRNQGILTFLVFLLAILGLWFMVVPGMGELLATKQRISQYASARDLATQLKTLINKQYATYDEELAKGHDYLKAVPNSVSQSDLLVEIQDMAALSGLEADSVDIDVRETNKSQAPGSGNGPALKSVPVKISLAGDYPALRQFISLAERNLPLLDASELSISAGGAADKTEKTEKKAAHPFKFQMTFQTYALR